MTPPTISWISPVTSEGQRYDASSGTVNLEVAATDADSGVNRVHFYRWDAANQVFVDIATDTSQPYRASVSVGNLNMEWNEISATAYDNAGNSTHTYFWIYRVAPTPTPTRTPTLTRTPSPTRTPRPTRTPTSTPTNTPTTTPQPGSDTTPPDGYITSPSDNSTIGPATIQITADAQDNAGGSGVKQVKFYVFYDWAWRSAGVDSSSPYETTWQVPDQLRSQQLSFAIHVVDNAGNTSVYPGGIRRVSFIEALGDPAIAENWVPTRAYLNQRALPGGWEKSSVASMAMVLAMNDLIGADYNTMSAKANQMFPKVLASNETDQTSVAYLGLMAIELRRQGALANYYGGSTGVTADGGWELIKQEVDAGRPVIMFTAGGALTSDGHAIVAVGYREADTSREVIAYDPYGRWLGVCCENNYDTNVENDPTSSKGRWVRYDFDTIFGSRNHLLTAARESNASSATTPNTPPDATSDEPADIDTYEGIPVEAGLPPGYTEIFLPLTRKG